jgi:hypothetical protein
MRNKQPVVLDNGKTAHMPERNPWTAESAEGAPVLFSGWAPGKPSHYSIGFGLALAVAEKFPEVIIGNFTARNGAGEEVSIPVVDPKIIHENMMETFIRTYDLNVPELRRVRSSPTKMNLQKLLADETLVQQLPPEILEKLQRLL